MVTVSSLALVLLLGQLRRLRLGLRRLRLLRRLHLLRLRLRRLLQLRLRLVHGDGVFGICPPAPSPPPLTTFKLL